MLQHAYLNEPGTYSSLFHNTFKAKLDVYLLFSFPNINRVNIKSVYYLFSFFLFCLSGSVLIPRIVNCLSDKRGVNPAIDEGSLPIFPPYDSRILYM